jgi:acyl-CoA thioesterase
MPPPDSDSSGKSKETGEEWENGNAYIPFAQLMAFKRLDDLTFESTHPAYSPGGFTRAFGGHVLAQAPLVAGSTVKPGFVLHVSFFWK